MYQPLGEVALRSGETVEAGVITGPDAQWRERILHLLAHKPPIWQWQMEQFFSRDLGIEPRIHVLHRHGVPFSHILTVEYGGVGLLGHVWTVPEERGQSAASLLMDALLDNFRERGGKALYLATGYDSSPYRIYAKHGFCGIEPGSGVMTWFRSSQEEFEKRWFADGPVEIVPLDWTHYATASALFAGRFPGVVRSVPLRIFGRALTEGPLLPCMKEGTDNPEATGGSAVLQLASSGALAGLASWAQDLTWPGTAVVDVYCHPQYWDHAGDLLARLEIPAQTRVVAYAEEEFVEKRTVLETTGFQENGRLARWLAGDAAGSALVDVMVYERR